MCMFLSLSVYVCVICVCLSDRPRVVFVGRLGTLVRQIIDEGRSQNVRIQIVLSARSSHL